MLTLDITYAVVPDSVVIPGNIDLIIDWDVISRPYLCVENNDYGLKLHHNLLNIPKVLTLRSVNNIIINQTDLKENLNVRIESLLVF